MRIRNFAPIIQEHAELHKLSNCSLVIDGQNFFYDCYKESGLRYEFGAECDRYAEYLRNHLAMFKNANIKCYFIFKGGTTDFEKKINFFAENSKDRLGGGTAVHPNNENKIDPIFAKDINLQVLTEMEFEYCFSEYECKSDCITLARKISCAVLSNDIEFPLSGVRYIPKSIFCLNRNYIHCKLFTLTTFLEKFKLDRNKLALFILLTDEKIFPENSFNKLFESIPIPVLPWERNKPLLRWLSNTNEQKIWNNIVKHSEVGKELILDELKKLQRFVKGEINSEVAYDFFFNPLKITDWFVRGVAMNNIAKEYIDMYRSKILLKKLHDDVDYTELSLNIIKYAFDILTNFENDGLKFMKYYEVSKRESSIDIKESISKPNGIQTIFFNMRSLDLFQHFLSETIQFDCSKLQMVPDDAKLLMITLVYILHVSKSEPIFTTEMAHGILLSYVMLGVVVEELNGVRDGSVTIPDCKSALASLGDYFKTSNVHCDENLLIPLKQFQYCLVEMNYLNKLCGSPFEPTSYRKTYNGTFVYNIIQKMETKGIIPSVKDVLDSAPTVRRNFLDIIKIYENLISLD